MLASVSVEPLPSGSSSTCAVFAAVTWEDHADMAPVPTAFLAAMRKTWLDPLVRPVIVAVVSVDIGRMNLTGLVPPVAEYSITYSVIGEPLAAGAAHVSVTFPSPVTPVGAAGASGAVAGMVSGDVCSTAGPSPSELRAATRK